MTIPTTNILIPTGTLPPRGACDAFLPLTGALPLTGTLPQRRTVRLAGYDYSQAGWYFVTIATKDRQPLLSRIGAGALVEPTPLGEVVGQCWHALTTRYEHLHADCWVLMPDHVHLLLGLLPATSTMSAKPLGQLVGAFKASCTRLGKRCGTPATSIWQRNYHEHIIRTATDLDNHRQYVRDNPRRWAEKYEVK